MAKADKKSKKTTNTPGSNKRNSKDYSTVPVTDTDDTEPRHSSKKDTKSKTKSKPSKHEKGGKDKKDKKNGKDKSKKKGRRGQETEDDELEGNSKPRTIVAPLPRLSREEYKFFELVKSGNVNAVEGFLKSDRFTGMDINKTDRTGFTILHYSVRRQDEDMTKLLIRQPGIRLYDTLLYAIKEGDEVITKMLLEVYDAAASDEEKQRFVSSLNGSNHSQEQIEALVSTTSRLRVSPRVSSTSARSGVKASVRFVLEDPPPPQAKNEVVLSQPSRSDTSVQSSAIKSAIEEDAPYLTAPGPIPFDSEFPPVLTPFMLAAQQGSLPLMELFYNRDERLENTKFAHNIGCSCDICAKLDGDQDMTRTFQRYHLFKALTQPEYICFMCRKEKIDPVNYAIQKILKVREIIEVDQAYNQLFSGLEEELEEFISQLLKLCRNTNEVEIFLSPKDAEGKERLPHLYPRLWYAVGAHLKKFVAEPNAQSIVYKIWATDDWPSWDTFSTLQRVFNVGIRVLLFPVIALILLVAQDTGAGRVLGCPVSRFLTYLGSYIFFLMAVGVQALFPYQRCNDVEPYYQIDDNHCKQRGPPNIGTEWILIVYVISFFVSILKKHSVSWYWKMRWSWYELITQLCFAVTFIFWGYSWLWVRIPENQPLVQATDRLMWPHNCAEIFGECFLAVSFMLASGRILQFFTVLPDLGPVQIILGKQIIDFINTMIIMVVVIWAFASGMLGLYLPYKDFHGLDQTDAKREKLQDDSYHSVVSAFKTFFFVLYEHGGPETTKLLTWNVKNESGAVEEIHHTYNEKTGLFLFMTYNMIGCTMLFAMLSGYFAQTAEEVTENVDIEWKFARTEFYFTFIKETMLPPPFNLIPTLRGCVNGARFMRLVGKKNDPRSACSCRQCCYITSNKKTEKWKGLMRGYRQLVHQLVCRYIFQRAQELQEKAATKEDVLELGEELRQIKAMLKKGRGDPDKSSDDDDNEDGPPWGGRGGSIWSMVSPSESSQSRDGATESRQGGRSKGPRDGGASSKSGTWEDSRGAKYPGQSNVNGEPQSTQGNRIKAPPGKGDHQKPAPTPSKGNAPPSPTKKQPPKTVGSMLEPSSRSGSGRNNRLSPQKKDAARSEKTPSNAVDDAKSGKLSYYFEEPPVAQDLINFLGNCHVRDSKKATDLHCPSVSPYELSSESKSSAEVATYQSLQSRTADQSNYSSQVDGNSCGRSTNYSRASNNTTPSMTPGLLDVSEKRSKETKKSKKGAGNKTNNVTGSQYQPHKYSPYNTNLSPKMTTGLMDVTYGASADTGKRPNKSKDCFRRNNVNTLAAFYSANNSIPSPKMTTGLLDVSDMTWDEKGQHSQVKRRTPGEINHAKAYSPHNTIPSPKMTQGLMDVNEMANHNFQWNSRCDIKPESSVDNLPFSRRKAVSIEPTRVNAAHDISLMFSAKKCSKFTGAEAPTPPRPIGLFDVNSPVSSCYDANYNQEPIGQTKVQELNAMSEQRSSSAFGCQENCASVARYPRRPAVPSILVNFSSDESSGKATVGSECW